MIGDTELTRNAANAELNRNQLVQVLCLFRVLFFRVASVFVKNKCPPSGGEHWMYKE